MYCIIVTQKKSRLALGLCKFCTVEIEIRYVSKHQVQSRQKNSSEKQLLCVPKGKVIQFFL